MRHQQKINVKEEGLLFGVHPLLEAIKAGKEIDRVLLANGTAGPLISEIKKHLSELDVPVIPVPKEKLMQFTRFNHQGVVAYISPVSFMPLEEVLQRVYESGKDPLFMVLDRVTDVRNFGAICRTAECAGVDAIIVPARGSARICADALKTSAGALMNIPVCRSMNLKDTLQMLKDSGIRIAGASEKADKMMYDTDLSGPICLIMGSEETGISPEYLKKCDALIRIPMFGSTGSLNVSVAAGVITYEIIRQRQP
jgi:23S rRNA (guanosine2251-2'-O)-methyltransferase